MGITQFRPVKFNRAKFDDKRTMRHKPQTIVLDSKMEVREFIPESIEAAAQLIEAVSAWIVSKSKGTAKGETGKNASSDRRSPAFDREGGPRRKLPAENLKSQPC